MNVQRNWSLDTFRNQAGIPTSTLRTAERFLSQYPPHRLHSNDGNKAKRARRGVIFLTSYQNDFALESPTVSVQLGVGDGGHCVP